MTFLVIIVVSVALIFGALWGIYGKLSKSTEGFMVAIAGGALMVSTMLELIEPATKNASMHIALLIVINGGITFTYLDYLVKKKWGRKVAEVCLLR